MKHNLFAGLLVAAALAFVSPANAQDALVASDAAPAQPAAQVQTTDVCNECEGVVLGSGLGFGGRVAGVGAGFGGRVGGLRAGWTERSNRFRTNLENRLYVRDVVAPCSCAGFRPCTSCLRRKSSLPCKRPHRTSPAGCRVCGHHRSQSHGQRTDLPSAGHRHCPAARKPYPKCRLRPGSRAGPGAYRHLLGSGFRDPGAGIFLRHRRQNRSDRPKSPGKKQLIPAKRYTPQKSEAFGAYNFYGQKARVITKNLNYLGNILDYKRQI